MPTITCSLNDLNKLAKTNLTFEKLNEYSDLFKGEIKSYNSASDELKVELQDTNRPDLWSVEGIARQLRFKLTPERPQYPWFHPDKSTITKTMEIDPQMQFIRPYAGGFAVRGVDVTEDVLIASIQTQEKIADGLGRKRKTISIGIYDLNQIEFPIHYCAVGRTDVQFVPLGMTDPMTPEEILEKHPKGIEYRHTLERCDRVPMLIDNRNEIMSFPPIINSRGSGEVKTGRRDLFIEATGTELFHLTLALNIFAVNMADRGGQVEAVIVKYPFETPLGREIRIPMLFHSQSTLELSRMNQWLGCAFDSEHVAKLLQEYGYQTDVDQEKITVIMPPWRRDLLHQVDVIEDLAISVGYNQFVPQMPKTYTVGALSPMTRFDDRIRDIVLPFGFEEIISNILCAKDEFAQLVREPDRRLVEISNPMTEKFAAVRDRIIPSLLRVERDSSSATYPHRIFEVGEVTVLDDSSDTGCKTNHRLGLMISDREAEFATAHAYLLSILYQLKLDAVIHPLDLPLFIPGRSGEIFIGDTQVGCIGELHPEVLENFQISMPCVAFEIDLNILTSLVKMII